MQTKPDMKSLSFEIFCKIFHFTSFKPEALVFGFTPNLGLSIFRPYVKRKFVHRILFPIESKKGEFFLFVLSRCQL
jgi:hypothetical protein